MDKILIEGYNNSLKNKLYALLCEFESQGDWEKFLDSIIIELYAVPEERQSINYLHLYRKICSLRYLRYEYFRKTIFDCLSLLGKSNELL